MLSMTSRQTAALIVMFVAASLALLLLDQQNRLGPVKGSAEKLINPFVLVFDRVGDRLGTARGVSSSGLEQQLANVTAERDRLLAENARLRQLEQEVDQLQKQLGFQQSRPELRAVTAHVISRDPSGVQQFVMIDRGANDGIQRGMAVISPDYFVGRVSEVSADRARITLSIDASSRVGATLQNANGDGILVGRRQAGGQLELRHLDPNTPVSDGDLVVTSERTALVPPGLIVGRAVGMDRKSQSDTLTVFVAPLVDFDSLQSVTVIIGDRSDQ